MGQGNPILEVENVLVSFNNQYEGEMNFPNM